jgi:hypothetical protein
MSKTHDRLVLATGEGANTHAVIAASKISFSEMREETIKFEIKDEFALVTHEEHGTIRLSTGVYYKTNQVEFNPFDNSVSRIFD